MFSVIIFKLVLIRHRNSLSLRILFGILNRFRIILLTVYNIIFSLKSYVLNINIINAYFSNYPVKKAIYSKHEHRIVQN